LTLILQLIKNGHNLSTIEDRQQKRTELKLAVLKFLIAHWFEKATVFFKKWPLTFTYKLMNYLIDCQGIRYQSKRPAPASLPFQPVQKKARNYTPTNSVKLFCLSPTKKPNMLERLSLPSLYRSALKYPERSNHDSGSTLFNYHVKIRRPYSQNFIFFLTFVWA
jgi:hypothetical protein